MGNSNTSPSTSALWANHPPLVALPVPTATATTTASETAQAYLCNDPAEGDPSPDVSPINSPLGSPVTSPEGLPKPAELQPATCKLEETASNVEGDSSPDISPINSPLGSPVTSPLRTRLGETAGEEAAFTWQVIRSNGEKVTVTPATSFKKQLQLPFMPVGLKRPASTTPTSSSNSSTTTSDGTECHQGSEEKGRKRKRDSPAGVRISLANVSKLCFLDLSTKRARPSCEAGVKAPAASSQQSIDESGAAGTLPQPTSQLPPHQHEQAAALPIAHRDRAVDDGEANAQLREAALKLLASAPCAASEHLICPLGREVMHDPVFAEDGFTYDRRSIEAWIRRQLPPGGHNYAVPGPNGEAVSLATLRPNKYVQMAVERWQRKRRALELVGSGRTELSIARRLRSTLEQVSTLQRGQFGKTQRLSHIEVELREVLKRELAACQAAQDEEARIAEKELRMHVIEEQLRVLALELEDLRSTHDARRQQLSAHQQQAASLRAQTTFLQHSGATLFCEAEEAKVELDDLWLRSAAYLAQLTEAGDLSADLHRLIEEQPEATAGLRHELERSHDDLERELKEVKDIQQQLAKELCRGYRAMTPEGPAGVEVLSRARDLGSREARYLLSKCYMRCNDSQLKAKAQSYLMRLVASDEQDVWTTKALYQLGLYHQHQGGDMSADQALGYFRSAASRGVQGNVLYYTQVKEESVESHKGW